MLLDSVAEGTDTDEGLERRNSEHIDFDSVLSASRIIMDAREMGGSVADAESALVSSISLPSVTAPVTAADVPDAATAAVPGDHLGAAAREWVADVQRMFGHGSVYAPPRITYSRRRRPRPSASMPTRGPSLGGGTSDRLAAGWRGPHSPQSTVQGPRPHTQTGTRAPLGVGIDHAVRSVKSRLRSKEPAVHFLAHSPPPPQCPSAEQQRRIAERDRKRAIRAFVRNAEPQDFMERPQYAI